MTYLHRACMGPAWGLTLTYLHGACMGPNPDLPAWDSVPQALAGHLTGHKAVHVADVARPKSK